jgi:hypothetical protein
MVALLCSVALAVGLTDEKIGDPKDRDPGVVTDATPPMFCLARMGEKDTLIVQTLSKLVKVEREGVKKVKEGDDVKEVRYKYHETLAVLEPTTYPLKNVQAFGVDGKKLDAKVLAERLAKDTPVVVSVDGKEVRPLYLKALNENTVVLILKQPETPKKLED